MAFGLEIGQFMDVVDSGSSRLVPHSSSVLALTIQSVATAMAIHMRPARSVSAYGSVAIASRRA